MSTIRPVTDSELKDALALALSSSHNGRAADPQHVQSFTHYLESCAIPWKAARCERAGATTALAFALLPPGRTAIVLFPAPGELGVAAEDQLAVMSELLTTLSECDLHYAQALVEPGVSTKSHMLRQLGFWRLAELNYLERDPGYPWVDPPAGEGLTWITYAEGTHAEFSATIEASYEQSGDCPKLNGLRPIEDVVASHRATGEFDPRLWQLARVAGRNAACLLLSRLTHGPMIELVYMGVAPAFRRRGLGSIVLRRALDLCRRAGARKLTLVVDSSNESASRLYDQFDFQRVTARDAYLYQWGPKRA